MMLLLLRIIQLIVLLMAIDGADAVIAAGIADAASQLLLTLLQMLMLLMLLLLRYRIMLLHRLRGRACIRHGPHIFAARDLFSPRNLQYVYGLYVCIGPPTKDLLIFFPFEL
jgi:hypothetical protein